jgi:DNA-binding transcriptional regulator YhcF (GntR family)
LASEIGPDYRQVIDLFRGMIASGQWPVGQPIPSTLQLKEAFPQFGVTTLRRAVQQLQKDGILEGHPGKGVFVKAMPADADDAHLSVNRLSDEVAQLRKVADKAAGLTGGYDDLREQVNDLRLRVAYLETELMDLKASNGTLTQGGGKHDQQEQPARRRQSAR